MALIPLSGTSLPVLLAVQRMAQDRATAAAVSEHRGCNL